MDKKKAFYDRKSRDDKEKSTAGLSPSRKKISATYLENAGVYYLGRFSASTERFRDVMMRKIKLSCNEHEDQDFKSCLSILDEVIEKFTKLGYLNDENYTKALYQSLLNRGVSLQKIRVQLVAKGCPKDDIEKALSEYAPPEDHEILAALRLAKRKKLGPYGTWPEDKIEKRKLYQKQLAVFSRQNFSYKIAIQILNMDETNACDFITPSD